MRALTALLTAAWLLLVAASASAQSTVFLVRHAERADAAAGVPAPKGADPDLSSEGRARADSLAALLKDAGITAIFVTEYKRTKQTAAPLAASLRVTPTTVPASDAAGLARALGAASGNVLVVGHSNTLPDAIKALGITAPVTIADAEFDNLFVVVRGATPTLVRLRYR